MIIREEQMQALQEEMFVSWIVSEVRRDYPHSVNAVRADRVHDMVRQGLRRAKAYGLSDEPVLATFVTTMFFVSPNFDEHPPVREVLLDTAIPEKQKFSHLHETLTVADWKTAHQLHDNAAWTSLPVLRARANGDR